MLNKEKHRQIMFNILKDIFESDLSSVLAFKWWTCAYFLYWLERFSTDLDFDLIWIDQNLDKKLIQILNKYWKIKEWQKRLILSYWKKDYNIKIDICRNINKSNNYKILNFFGTDIRVQEKSTMFSNKLIALLERNTNRDIYDVYFFLKNTFDINENLILERTKETKKELFLKIVKKLEKLWTNYKILDWLWEVLKDEKHKSFVKNKLINDLIWLLKFEINHYEEAPTNVATKIREDREGVLHDED